MKEGHRYPKCPRRRASPSTLEDYATVVEKFQEWCQEREIPFRRAAARAFEEFMAARERRRPAGGS